MSKSNSIKKLNSKRLSPANPEKTKQVIKKSSLSNPNKNKVSNNLLKWYNKPGECHGNTSGQIKTRNSR